MQIIFEFVVEWMVGDEIIIVFIGYKFEEVERFIIVVVLVDIMIIILDSFLQYKYIGNGVLMFEFLLLKQGLIFIFLYVSLDGLVFVYFNQFVVNFICMKYKLKCIIKFCLI